MARLELVIFDMDGTLYRLESGGRDGAIFKTGFYKEIEDNGVKLISRRLSITIREAEVIRQEIFKKYDGDVSVGLEESYMIPHDEYFSDVWDVDAARYVEADSGLRGRLSDIASKKALLTSAPRVWAQNVLKRLNIADIFDGLWFGDDSIRKPDRRAYMQVCDALGVDPRNALMVDDEPKCLMPAKDLGMATALLGREKWPWIDYNLANISELDYIVRR